MRRFVKDSNLSLHVTRAGYIILTLGVFWAAACTPRVMKQESSLTEPKLAHASIICADGARLPLKSWLPDISPSAVIIALHGFNDYSKFIEQTALFLADQGMAVYAYDQRGFGQAPDWGLWPDLQTLIDDLKTVVRLLRKQYPDIPLYLLGESMGGAVLMTAMAGSDPPICDGVVLSAPAVWSRAFMPWPQRVLLWVAAHTVPWMKVTGESLKIRASDNTEMLQGLSRDPLVIKKTRIDAVYGLANLMDAASASASQYTPRTLILYGEKDEVIPKDPILHAFNRMPGNSSGRQRLVLYKNGYHLLLRDLQADIVRRDIVEWLKNPNHQPPSAAENLSIEISGKDIG